MSKTVFLKVSSAFLVGGQLAKAGEIVEVTGTEAKDLLARGKATVATVADAPVEQEQEQEQHQDEVQQPEAEAEAEAPVDAVAEVAAEEPAAAEEKPAGKGKKGK